MPSTVTSRLRRANTAAGFHADSRVICATRYPAEPRKFNAISIRTYKYAA